MKQLSILLVFMTCLLFSASLGVFSLLGICQFSQYVEYEGQLDRTASQNIVLLSNNTAEPIKLSFAYDQDSDLVISDFTHVNVSGYYNSVSNVLMVEEIEAQSDCYFGP